MVDHAIFLNKLEKLGLRGPTVSWYEGFIIGRKQQVKIKTHEAKLLP